MFSCNLVNAIEWGFWMERRPVGSPWAHEYGWRVTGVYGVDG